MASILQSISLALSLANNDPSAHDGRLAWKDYAWVTPAFAACIGPSQGELCHAAHQKWDWKRNQWVDFFYSPSPAGRKITVRLALTDNDRADDDYVCVTVLFVDAAGNDLVVFHQNWHIEPKTVVDKTFTATVDPAVWARVSKVLLGSKQCRDGAHQDDGVFAEAVARTGQSQFLPR